MNTPPYPLLRVNVKGVIDELRPKQWNLYECDVELVDGTIIQGCSIEGSTFGGAVLDYDSLMDEAGNPFSTWTFALQSGR